MKIVSGPLATPTAPAPAPTPAAPAAPRAPAPKSAAARAPAPAAPVRQAAPVAPSTPPGQVGRANADLLAQVRGEQDAARQARYGGLVTADLPDAAGTLRPQERFASDVDPMAFYAKKLEDVARLRREGAIGPRSGAEQALMRTEYVPPTPGEELAGVKPLALQPKEGRGIELSPTVIETPTSGAGGAMNSVAAFRQKAEQLGLRYRAARQAAVKGEGEIETAKTDPYALVSDRPKLAAAQRARMQELVNARESLRQFGFNDEEIAQKFGN